MGEKEENDKANINRVHLKSNSILITGKASLQKHQKVFFDYG